MHCPDPLLHISIKLTNMTAFYVQFQVVYQIRYKEFIIYS